MPLIIDFMSENLLSSSLNLSVMLRSSDTLPSSSSVFVSSSRSCLLYLRSLSLVSRAVILGTVPSLILLISFSISLILSSELGMPDIFPSISSSLFSMSRFGLDFMSFILVSRALIFGTIAERSSCKLFSRSSFIESTSICGACIVAWDFFMVSISFSRSPFSFFMSSSFA